MEQINHKKQKMKRTEYFDTEAQLLAKYPQGIVPSGVVAILGNGEKVYMSSNNYNGVYTNNSSISLEIADEDKEAAVNSAVNSAYAYMTSYYTALIDEYEERLSNI